MKKRDKRVQARTVDNLNNYQIVQRTLRGPCIVEDAPKLLDLNPAFCSFATVGSGSNREVHTWIANSQTAVRTSWLLSILSQTLLSCNVSRILQLVTGKGESTGNIRPSNAYREAHSEMAPLWSKGPAAA